MMLIPLTDASRRPMDFPAVTAAIIGVNVLMFILELLGGDDFVMHWSVIPADIVAGRHWINILTGMFMHASWSHIIGNMVFSGRSAPGSRTSWGAAATSSSISSAVWWPSSGN